MPAVHASPSATPGRGSPWLKQLGVLAIGAAVAVLMVVLGLWQLRVYSAQGLRAAEERAAAPTVSLTKVAPAGSTVRDGYGRTVRFDCQYLPDQQQLVPLAGSPDRFRVLTACRLADGSAVAVVRGVIQQAADDPVVQAPAPPSGPVSQSGILLPSEDTDSAPASPGQLRPVRIPALAQQWPQPLVDGFVVLGAADAQQQGLEPAPLALPEGRGRLRNGAYALQWWIFAAFAILMAARIARDIGQQDDIVDDPLVPPT